MNSVNYIILIARMYRQAYHTYPLISIPLRMLQLVLNSQGSSNSNPCSHILHASLKGITPPKSLRALPNTKPWATPPSPTSP